MNSTGQSLTRLIWAYTVSMGFLMAVGILGSDRLDSVVDRPVLFIAGFLPLGQSRSLTSAIVLASVAVLIYAAVFWFVLTAWNRLRSR